MPAPKDSRTRDAAAPTNTVAQETPVPTPRLGPQRQPALAKIRPCPSHLTLSPGHHDTARARSDYLRLRSRFNGSTIKQDPPHLVWPGKGNANFCRLRRELTMAICLVQSSALNTESGSLTAKLAGARRRPRDVAGLEVSSARTKLLLQRLELGVLAVDYLEQNVVRLHLPAR